MPVSPVPWTLVDFAPSEFAQLVDDGSPVYASAGALTNELGMAAQAVSGETTNPLSELLNGVSPPPSTPGDFVGFSGEPSLLERLLVSVLDFAEPFEKLLGVSFESTLTPLIESASPPALLTALDGLTVTETNFDGMPVFDLTPADPSVNTSSRCTAGATWTSRPPSTGRLIPTWPTRPVPLSLCRSMNWRTRVAPRGRWSQRSPA